MANKWFQFKQFKVHQRLSAMKVGTDGVLLGAWADISQSKNILDLGTGTGLVALMLAQRNQDALITAIDIDKLAIQEAKENIKCSPFSKRIKVIHISGQELSKYCENKFDHLVCNPPYFENNKNNNEGVRAIARQTITLTHQELIDIANQCIQEEGLLTLILPSNLYSDIVYMSEKTGWNLIKSLEIKPTNNKPVNRIILTFSKKKINSYQSQTIVVEPTNRHQYSQEYKELLKDFMLNF
ncbi:MAG: methyltransferase [Bacteroidales bacterium]|nr:methyltransferase [Bacteroidales bacterium]